MVIDLSTRIADGLSETEATDIVEAAQRRVTDIARRDLLRAWAERRLHHVWLSGKRPALVPTHDQRRWRRVRDRREEGSYGVISIRFFPALTNYDSDWVKERFLVGRLSKDEANELIAALE